MNLASREQRGEATTHHHTTEKTVEEKKLARLTKAQLTALLKEQTERLEGMNTKHLLAALFGVFLGAALF
jgi:hypothetical protein